MKHSNWSLCMRGIYMLLVMFIFSPVSCMTDRVAKNKKGNFVIENNNFKYEMTENGKNLHFVDKATGTDYLDNSVITYAASINTAGKEYIVNSVVLKGKHLKLLFEKKGVSVEVLIEENKSGVTFEIIKVIGHVDSLNFLNIPLKLKGIPDEPFATCALSMNLQTHVKQLPALQTHLWASCYHRFGMEGAKITLIGVPMKSILSSIREVMEGSKAIPYSTAGGAWAEESKEGYGSYLFNFGELTEETVDDWIEMCQSLGFNQINSHGGREALFKFGSLELSSERWPNGWEHFKRINKRLHDAGISHILHTYSMLIDKKSKYVTPVPHEGLAYFSSFTLAKPIGLEDSSIVVNESTKNISTITGSRGQRSLNLKIGNELIEFEGVTKTPPYKFIGCQRGLNGTKAIAHKANEKAYHLKQVWGLFVPDPDSELFKEIAHNIAKTVNENNFDGIYLDGLEASHILAEPENSWYYGAQFVTEIMRTLDHPVGMEMSSMEHHHWHYRSRWQAWDIPRRGYKRFIDIHANSINGGRLLPLHLGWWGNFTFEPPNIEPTFYDDIEYLCCKMIGYNAGLSIQRGVSKEQVNKYPSFRRLNAIIKQYEELRHKNYFGEEVKRLLRQPGEEFTLYQESNGKWNFKPIAYQKHKITGLDHSTAQWIVNNKFKSQPVKLRIEPLMSVKPYNDPSGIVLTDFSKPTEFINKSNADGVSGQITTSAEKLISGEQGALFSAQSSGKSPQNGSFISMEKSFTSLLDLRKNQALGVWIKGDGSGQILNLSVSSPLHISYGARGDHFITVDFTGWKYFELVEVESSEISNYKWDNNNSQYSFSRYNIYRDLVEFKKIEKLQLWYNNLPVGKRVSTTIGPIKALPMVSDFIDNPSITIGGETVVFPVRMESGMYLEFLSADNCKLYDSRGELIAKVKPEGTIPELKKGVNKILFWGESSNEVNARVQVTVISEDNPLDIKK